jgi:putative IMPACT (imprinted ancient) family translation regulator
MVKIKYWQRISITGKSRGQRNSKFDKNKLKNGLTAREYRNEIENFLETPSNIEDQPVETMWKHVKQSIHKASENILGYYTKKKRNEWHDEECRTMLEIRNAARMKMLQRKTRTNIQEYKMVQREAKLVCKRKTKGKVKRKNWKNSKKDIKEMNCANSMKEYGK